uniref:Phosphatidylethanolamine N-methyltransferase n=1 Tax=Oncorhynchus kisutch TaxID=8019 RepID=A0A8C7J3H2_ONCKI
MSGVADKRNPVLDCCGGLNNVDYSKVDMSVMEDVLKHIDVYDPRFCVAVIAIIFNPFFWNVLIRPHDSQWSQTVGAQTTVARWEHRTRGLTRLFGGPYLACYCLGTLIILLNVYRSHRNASPVGLVLTAVVAISYQVAIIFEGPFTEEIYRQRAQCCKHK